MASAEVLAALQAQRAAVAAAEAAIDHHYPKYVKPDPAAWGSAKTVEERNAAKVLVLNEVEHRIVAPQDFPEPKKTKGKGDDDK